MPNFGESLIYLLFFLDLFIFFFYLTVFIRYKIKNKELKTGKNFDITFVIPAYNAEKYLKKTVESIEGADYPRGRINIIIVNDGSVDNTLKIANGLATKYNNIEVLSKKNEGYKASALNFGLKRAKTELVAVLDADTIVEKDLLKKAMPHFSDESIMAVTSRFKPINNNKLLEKLQYIEYTTTGFFRKLMGAMQSLPFAPAFTIFRREFFLKHGYFDVGNLTEDFEIGLRINKFHYNIACIFDSYALTEVPDTLRKLFRQRMRWIYGALYNYKKYREIFFNKEYGNLGFFVLPSGLLTLVAVCVSIIVSVYTIIDSIVKYVGLLSLGWVPSFSSNLTQVIFALTSVKFVLILITILIGLIAFLFIRSESGERLPFGIYIIFATVYLIYLSIISVITLSYFVIGVKPKW